MQGDKDLTLLYLLVVFTLLSTCSGPDKKHVDQKFSSLRGEIAELKREVALERASRDPSAGSWVADGCDPGTAAIILRTNAGAGAKPAEIRVPCAPTSPSPPEQIERP